MTPDSKHHAEHINTLHYCPCPCDCPAPGRRDDDGTPGWCDSCRMNIHQPWECPRCHCLFERPGFGHEPCDAGPECLCPAADVGGPGYCTCACPRCQDPVTGKCGCPDCALCLIVRPR